jgi:hypothetical protein
MLIGAETLKEATVIENVSSSIPSLSVTWLDDKRRAASFGVFVDGAKLEVTIGDGKSGKTPNVYQMRQWSLSDGTANTGGDLVTLSGVADLIPWFRKTVTKPYKGNTSDVISQLVQDAGNVQTDTDTTQDKQTWHPDNRTMSQFARGLMDHSWAGEGSSMFLAMTSDQGQWMLRYKDIMKGGGGGGKT